MAIREEDIERYYTGSLGKRVKTAPGPNPIRTADAEHRARVWLDAVDASFGSTDDWTIDWDSLTDEAKATLQTALEHWGRVLRLPRTPNLKQLRLILATERGIDEPILFGGAQGGGKSSGLVMAAIRACRNVYNNRAVLCRATFAALRLSTLLELEEQLADCPDAVIQKGEHRVYFPNTGSYLWYMGAGRPTERQRLRSMQWGWIGIDELTELDEQIFNELTMRLRWGPAKRANALQLVGTCNPEPGWVKENWISDPRPGYRFIPSLPQDNPHLNDGDIAGYIKSVKRRMPREWVDAMIYGDWNAWAPSDAAIPEPLIRAALKRSDVEPDDNDCVWGVDVGRGGEDYTSVWRRRGMVWDRIGYWRKRRTTVTCDTLETLYETTYPKPRRINIDDDGVGGGVSDQMTRRCYNANRRVLIGQVIAQSNPDKDTDPHGWMNFYNKKAQHAFLFRRILEEGKGRIIAPDSKSAAMVVADLATARSFQASKGGRSVYAIEAKDSVKKRLGRSPDNGDAVLETMFEGRSDYVPGHYKDAYKEAGRDIDEEAFMRELEEGELLDRIAAGFGT